MATCLRRKAPSASPREWVDKTASCWQPWLLQVRDLDVFAMGKRGSRSQSQLLNSLTKKQKKHLRDFGEEHPFYDKYGGEGRGGGLSCRRLFPVRSGASPGLARRSPMEWWQGCSRLFPLFPGAHRARVGPGGCSAGEDSGGIPPGDGVLLGSACLLLSPRLYARRHTHCVGAGFCVVRGFLRVFLFLKNWSLICPVTLSRLMCRWL